MARDLDDESGPERGERQDIAGMISSGSHSVIHFANVYTTGRNQ